MGQTKPYSISKSILWDAYQKVRSNGGAAGIDGMVLEKFARKEIDHLYKLWNRMSSGSYFPSSVLRVEIPKKSGGMRPLGIPTVLDRIAQMTARMYFEPIVEPKFHPDSYGYRPKRSAHSALGVTRERCWKYDWVIDLDIKGFFDTIDHDLMLKAVDHHKPPDWVRLYIERWLKVPAQDSDGNVYERNEGTPQGGVISPVLANLFLHHSFDEWMKKEHPANPFARYADDIVIHCRTLQEAEELLEAVRHRLKECRLTVHPEKTKIVYCKDANRQGKYACTEFDFLGFTFKPRFAKNRQGQFFMSFSPAISRKAEKTVKDEIRSWKLHTRTGSELEEMAVFCNPRIRGWLNYYGKFRRSALIGICGMINAILAKWVKFRYKKLKRNWKKAFAWLTKVAQQNKTLFFHWEMGYVGTGRI
jgi:RNA-directed DNA polymerase